MKQIIETPLGPMLAEGDEKALYSLKFVEGTRAASVFPPIKRELDLYFEGKLTAFKIPMKLQGTPFQQQVWKELMKIPFGETRSYAEIAKAIGRPTAYRAVAQANASNPIAILVPCHRVINTGGALGGYAYGVSRKQWLLEHEKS